MAKEFDVPFLGNVPIDPMFIRLIEEGKRPRYPEGTVVDGQDMRTTEQEEGAQDEGELVEKYLSCSLCPLFDAMTRRIVAAVEGANS